MNDPERTVQNLLDWYDREGRELPWRLHPRNRINGMLPNPYIVWLSEVMLQQTTVATVKDRFTKFYDLWPSVRHLADAQDSKVMAAWAGLGYYARARNLLNCARLVVSQYGGEFPADVTELRKLPGIGAYTAAAISSIAFDRPSAAVDGNVERVLSRLFALNVPLPKAKSQIRQLAAALCPNERPGDWLQALMDMGSLICKPRNPNCGNCPIATHCLGRIQGIQNELPQKNSFARRAMKLGILYVARRDDGAWLLEDRPAKGLLGGMLGWPGSSWDGSPSLPPPCVGTWRKVGLVEHSLTHLDLQLDVLVASLAMESIVDRGRFILPDQFNGAMLPTLMRKALKIAETKLSAKSD